MSTPASVDRSENALRFRVIQHVLPQPVVLLCACLGKPGNIAKRQMAVGVEAYGDSQGIGGQIACIAIVTDHLEIVVCIRCHIEATIAQGVELPVTTVVIGR